MRKFKCYDCGHIWEIPFGQGGRGVNLTCPQCESQNVHRLSKPRGRGWRGGGRVGDSDSSSEPGSRGWRRGWRGRSGGGWRRGSGGRLQGDQ